MRFVDWPTLPGPTLQVFIETLMLALLCLEKNRQSIFESHTGCFQRASTSAFSIMVWGTNYVQWFATTCDSGSRSKLRWNFEYKRFRESRSEHRNMGARSEGRARKPAVRIDERLVDRGKVGCRSSPAWPPARDSACGREPGAAMKEGPDPRTRFRRTQDQTFAQNLPVNSRGTMRLFNELLRSWT